MAFVDPDHQYGYQHAHEDPHGHVKLTGFFDDNDSAVLDSTILDADGMHAPDQGRLERASMVNDNELLSPPEAHGWEQRYRGVLAGDVASLPAASNSSFCEGNAVLGQHDDHRQTALPQTYVHPPPFQSWQEQQPSVHYGPQTGMPFAPHTVHWHTPQRLAHHMAEGVNVGANHTMPGRSLPSGYPVRHEPAYIPRPHDHAPRSPGDTQDWMTVAQQESESQRGSKRTRSSSPSSTFVDMQKQDGVRKKNGRIHIPEAHNIQTIDILIERETDEAKVKQLRQHKRLLRNREAALASRQRKKKHTEELETREKSFNRSISDLTMEMEHMRTQLAYQTQNNQSLVHQYQSIARSLHIAEEEKLTAARMHEEETSQLRRRIQLLTDQIEAGAAVMSAAPSSVGISDFNAEMEALTVGPHDWNTFMIPHEQSSDQNSSFAPVSNQNATTDVPCAGRNDSFANSTRSDPTKSEPDSTDSPVTSSLLFFLLLCGAFVASKSATPLAVKLPQLPPDVRAAAPEVLKNLLSNQAPLRSQASTNIGTDSAGPLLPTSQISTSAQPTRLEQMHNTITTPTKLQEINSAFSLTASQYSSISQLDYSTAQPSQAPAGATAFVPRPRLSVDESLANMRREHPQHSRAAVYTRSLLWAQVPPDTARQFCDMVRDYVELDSGPGSGIDAVDGPSANSGLDRTPLRASVAPPPHAHGPPSANADHAEALHLKPEPT